MNLLPYAVASRRPSRAGVRDGATGAHARLLPEGIAARLFVLILLTLLPLLLLVGWQYHERYQERYAQALQTEREVAHGVAALFAAFADNVQRSSRLVAQAIITFEHYTPEKASAVLTAAAGQYRAVRNMSWLAPDGRVLASSEPELVGRDLSQRGYFRAMRRGQGWAAGDLMAVGSVAARPTFAIAAAIRGRTGELLGAVVTGLDPSGLAGVMDGERRPEGGAYDLFDAHGILVFRNPDLEVAWARRSRWVESDPLLYRALMTGHEQAGITQPVLTRGTWVSARVPIDGLGWVAGSGRPLDAVLAPVRQRLQRDILLALASAGVALLLALSAARTIANPLRRLERDAAAFRDGKTEPHADPQAPKEVRRVRLAVEAMASDLRTHAIALRDAHQLLTEAERLSHTGAWEWDTTRDRWHFSEEWCAIHGVPHRTLTTSELALLAHPADLEAVGRAFEAVRHGRAPYELEHRIVRPDNGQVRVVRARGRYVRDGRGQVVRVYGFAQDITEQKLAEEALRVSEERYRLVNRATHDVVWDWDLARDEVVWNWAVEPVFGYAPDRVPRPAEWWRSHIHPEDRERVVNRIHAVIDGGGDAWSDEYRFRRADGDYAVVYDRGHIQRDRAGTAERVVGAMFDLTERKRMEESLRRTADDLRRLNVELEEFAYVASHDLKAPLRAVANLALVIQEDAAERLDDENRDRLQALRQRVITMDRLIEGLLTYARAGRSREPRRFVPLVPLLAEVVEELDPPPGFRVELAEPLPPLCADPLQLRQVFQNLLANAIAHHDRPASGHARVSAHDAGGHWTVEVVDDGPGIPGPMRDQVFRMFSTGGKVGHTGIGLAIVYKLVVANGARIEVADNAPRGACFRLLWPKPAVRDGCPGSGE